MSVVQHPLRMTGEQRHRSAVLFVLIEALNQAVRPLLAYGFGAAVIVFTAIGYLTPDAFLGIAAVVIGFFYNARQSERDQERLEQQQAQLLDLAKKLPPPENHAPPVVMP